MSYVTKRHVLEAAARGEGCLGKAADDEPVFILRAQDALAIPTIRFWLSELQKHVGSSTKFHQGCDDIQHFHQWAQDHPTKIPD